MKKLALLSICGALTLASCTDHGMGFDQTELIKENAENVFGLIDPKQDWSNVVSTSLTVTADASLKNISKVQILTESPFFNDQASVLAEVEATKGQTVTVNFDAPKGTDRLIVACVDANNNYFIKPFTVGDTQVLSFRKSSKARTRTVANVADALPDFSKVKMEYRYSVQSYNAQRTIVAQEAELPNNKPLKEWMENAYANNNTMTIANWKDKKWENDRLWMPTDQNTPGNNWIINKHVIRRDADALDADEEATLHVIFDNSLFRDDPTDGWGRRDNLKYIREGNAVRFFDNHLVSDGKNPITLFPIQLASMEIQVCQLYYYYYLPSEVPAGMDVNEYIKRIPKFKAMDLDYEREQFKNKTGISKTANDTTFLRLHEYLLPFYGENALFMPEDVNLSSLGTTDGKLYRIHSGLRYKGTDYYMTYTSQANRTMMPLYADDADNIENQLWQLFKMKNGKTIFYNVGAKKVMVWNDDYGITINDCYHNPDYLAFTYDEQGHHLLSNGRSWAGVYFATSTDDSKKQYNFAFDRSIKDEDRFIWTLEEFSGNVTPATNAVLKKYQVTYPTPQSIIKEGYRIGFMLRKAKVGNQIDNAHLTNDQDGCLYGNGELNTEINRFGQFYSSIVENKNTKYSMEINDPRIGMFNANGKTYLCFEDGSDAQYSDMIVELGGISTSVVKKESPSQPDTQNTEAVIEDDTDEGGSGVYMFDELEELPGIAYTMCFEDRPAEADYDMNDVVLRCMRMPGTNKLQLSVMAIGADDNVEIHGIPGKCTVPRYDIAGIEVHEMFGVADETGDKRFINTIASDNAPVSPASATYEVDPSMTIPQFLSQIYIKNLSKGYDVHVPKTGEAPYALIIPGDFNYPRERQSITGAYTAFLQWATNASNYGKWLNACEKEKIIINPIKYFGSSQQ